MMVIESCNVDMSTDIAGARDSFTKLTLSDYSDKNVGNLATTAL